MASACLAESALSFFTGRLLSRADLTAVGRAIIDLVRDSSAAAGDPELRQLLWWTAAIVEHEQNWQSPSAGHSVWPSGGRNNLGGSYRRYSLGDGTAATFPEYGERRLLFSGGAGFLSAVKAALLPYYRDRRPVCALLGDGGGEAVQRFLSRLASRSASFRLERFPPGRALERPEGEAAVLVLPRGREMTLLPDDALSRFERIVAAYLIGAEPSETIRGLPNATLCYTSPGSLGYGLEIVVPQRDLHRAMVLRQQRGGAITEEALKFFLFLLGGPGALASFLHEGGETPIAAAEDGAARPPSYVFDTQAQVRQQIRNWRPPLAEAGDPAGRYIQRLAEIVSDHLRRRGRDGAATLRGALQAERTLRAHAGYAALCDVLSSRDSRPAVLAKRVQELEVRQAAYHRLNVLSRKRGFPASETVVFNCGMAGAAAAVEYLALFKKSRRPVLFGRQSYNENEWLVRDYFPPDRIVFFEIDDLPALLDGVRQLQPLAIVLEAVSNSRELAAAPLDRLLEALARRPPGRALYLLADITAAGNSLPLERILAPGLPPNVTLFLAESLQKFYEHGLELSSGGALHILCSRREAAKDIRRSICQVRAVDASGLDPLSAAKLSLLRCAPESLREKARLHARNTRRLAAYVEGLGSPFLQAVCRTGPALCEAPYFWLIPAEHTYVQANLLLSSILERAWAHGVNIQNRDSFYFNNTVLHISRDYYQGLRVASGTESAGQMALIEKVFREALDAAHAISRRGDRARPDSSGSSGPHAAPSAGCASRESRPVRSSQWRNISA